MLKKLALPLLGVLGVAVALTGCGPKTWLNGEIAHPDTGYHYELDSGDGLTTQTTAGNTWEYTAWNDHARSTVAPGGTTYVRQDGWLQTYGAYPYSSGAGMDIYVNGGQGVYLRQYNCGWNTTPFYAYLGGNWQNTWPTSCSLVNAAWGS